MIRSWVTPRVSHDQSTVSLIVSQTLRDTLRINRHLPVQAAVAHVNPILRGWVNYFRVGNSSQAFNKVKYTLSAR